MKKNRWDPTRKYGATAQPGSLQSGMERIAKARKEEQAAREDGAKPESAVSRRRWPRSR
jgi:hypothetical protein